MRRQSLVLGVFVLSVLALLAALLVHREPPAPPPDEGAGAVPEAAAVAAGSASVEQPELERQPAAAPESQAVPAAAAPSPEELWGRVVAASDHRPIAGAEVQLLHNDTDEFWNLDLERARNTEVLATTRTESDGRFRFPVARAHLHRVHVSAAGYAEVTVMSCVGGAEIAIEVCMGASLDGVVRCEGKPMADVPVRIAVSGQSVELALGRTDAQGSYRFTGLPPANVFVQVQSPRHEEQWQRAVLLPDGVHHVDIDLAAGAALRGRVVDAVSRAPIADAEISDSWTYRRVVRSAADGSFELPGLRDEGFVEIQVRAAGYARASANLTGALDKPAELALVRGGEVGGRFVKDSGEATAGVYAAVAASFMESPGMQGTDWIRAEIAPDGRFLAIGLRSDQHYWLYVRGRGLGSRIYALPRPLASGERFDLGDIAVRAAGGVEGRVVDERGEPWAGVSVSVRGSNADSRRLLAHDAQPEEVSQFTSRGTRTDPQGNFRLTDLSAGNYTLAVQIQGRTNTQSTTVEVADAAIRDGVELVVSRGLSITGMLRYSDGRALGDTAAGLILSASAERHESVSARFDAAGRFDLAGLAEGSYTLSLFRGPKGWSMSPRTDVPAGSKDVELLLQPSGFVRGRVVDASGNAVKAQVWVRPDGDQGGSALHATDDAGIFEIEVPTDFHGSVGAMHPQQEMLQGEVADVSAGRSDLRVQLPSR